MTKQQESARNRLDAIEQRVRELWISTRECVEMPELHYDASIARDIELPQTIDPGREIRRVILGKGQLPLRVGMEIGRRLPTRCIEGVHLVPELLKAGEVLREQTVLVIEGDRAALQQSHVESVERRAFDRARRRSFFSEQTHELCFFGCRGRSRPNHRELAKIPTSRVIATDCGRHAIQIGKKPTFIECHQIELIPQTADFRGGNHVFRERVTKSVLCQEGVEWA